jgi:hypothetical protein
MATATLSAEHAGQLVNDGYTIVEGFLSPEELAETQEAVYSIAPTWEQYTANPDQHPPFALEFPDFPSRIQFNILRPDVLGLLEDVIGTPDLRLSLSFLWFRYAGRPWAEQELHSDLMNNTLVFPRDDGPYRQVLGILYYTDVTAGLSPTGVLPASVDFLRPGEDHWRKRESHPDYYDREIKVLVPAGSLLLYNLTSFHRGGAFTATEGHRVSHHFAFRSGLVEWGQWRGWAKEALKPEMATFLTQASPRQRHLFGFPLPGDPYWTADMIKGVARRYPEMDLTPYEQAPVGSTRG